eukprot:4204247-Prymnesium_polylepis.1
MGHRPSCVPVVSFPRAGSVVVGTKATPACFQAKLAAEEIGSPKQHSGGAHQIPALLSRRSLPQKPALGAASMIARPPYPLSPPRVT